MKTWKDVQPGDTIYYWDHCEMKKQYVHAVEKKTYEETHYDYYNPRRRTIEEKTKITLVVGKRHLPLEINDYWFNRSDMNHWDMHRFCCKEAAEKFLKNLTDRRLAKANRLQNELNQTLTILAKYELKNKNL